MKLKIIYAGKRLAGKKFYYVYWDIMSDKYLQFDKTRCTIGAVGTILEIETEDNKSYKMATPTGDMFEDKSKIAEWVVNTSAAITAYNITKKINKVPQNKYDDIIKELNWMLSDIPHSQKKAFKIKLILDLR